MPPELPPESPRESPFEQKSIEPMAAVDEMMFLGERDPARRPTTLAIYTLDRAPDPELFEHTFERASRELPRLRQRVVEPTGGIGPACWVTDPDFDLKYHVRRAELPDAAHPAPASEAATSKPRTKRDAEEEALRALIEVVEPELMTPLDLTRPLWQVTLYEGYGKDGAALVFKASHAIADGLGGMQMAGAIFDDKRDVGRRAMPPEPLPEDVTPDELARDALRTLPSRLPRALRGGLDRLTKLGRRALRDPEEVTDYVASLRRLTGDMTPPSPLLSARGHSRRLIVLDLPLDRFKQAARAAGGSLNDGYLAAICGAMRLYHERMGSPPIDAIPMAIPISIRKPEDEAGGNHFAGATLAGPIGERSLEARVADIHEKILAARNEPALGFIDELAPLFVGLPMALTGRLMGPMPSPDVQASNVPGQRDPIYVAGARVERQIGIGPVPGIAVMITMISYCDRCDVSFNYDPAAITDGVLFEACLREGFDELLALAPEPTPAKPRRPRKPRKSAAAKTATTAEAAAKETPDEHADERAEGEEA